MHASRRRQRGLTLIEIALGLALMVVVVGFALAQFTRMNEAERSRTMVHLVATLMKEVPKTAPSRAYAGLTSETLINLGVVPDQFIGEDGVSLITPWLEPMDISAYTFGQATQPNAVLISIQRLPKDACVEVIQALGRNMQVIEVDAEVLVQRASASPRLFSGLTPADVVAACGANEAPALRLVPNV